MKREEQAVDKFLPYLFIFLGLFVLLSLFSYTVGEEGIQKNWFGRFGHYFSLGMFYLFGQSAYFLGLFFLILGILPLFMHSIDPVSRIITIPVSLFSTSISFALIQNLFLESSNRVGGLVGEYSLEILQFLFGTSGSIVINLFMHLFTLAFFTKSEILKRIWNSIENFFTKTTGVDIQKTVQNISDYSKNIPLVNQWKLQMNPILQKNTNNILKNDFFSTKSNSSKIQFLDKKKYKPSRLFDGFFDDSKRVYQFEKSNVEVLKNNNFSSELISKKKFDVLDFRNSNSIQKNYTFIEDENEPMIEEEGFESESSILEPSISVLENENEEMLPVVDKNVYEKPLVERKNNDIEIEKNVPKEIKAEETNLKFSLINDFKRSKKGYNISTNFLKSTPRNYENGMSIIESDKTSRKIESIIKEYGYDAKVVSLERGPIITRYELSPPYGVKLGRITSLADELRLYLAVKNIRIVAPIPGKSTIGIEVPNSIREDVFLGDILKEKTNLKKSKDLSIIMGKDISGKIVTIDLNKLPHLLVAGTTGSGKSVCLNSMISSLVFNLSPDELRLIMIDPKMVELTLFEELPHLLMPVITDPKKSTRALGWAIQEMEHRYEIVSRFKCRDLKSYNQKVDLLGEKNGAKKMPYIVIVIDELSDLMMVSGKDLEDSITRISQKSRAVGIHLIMATQRPSVDVITGLIKANCPARIAFQVAQKTDSKIILDSNGAETLLGKGDFLYKSPTAPDLQRIQSPYISEEEIENIVSESKKFGSASFVEIDFDEETFETEADEEDEEIFHEAWEIIRSERKASASYLQRRLRIGYNKAARIMELMEERGYVSPQVGSKPREILRGS